MKFKINWDWMTVFIPYGTCLVVALAFMLVGCATTPEPVTRVNAMNLEAIDVLHYNTSQIIEGYTEKLKKAYESHMLEWYNTQVAKVTVGNGMIKITDMNQIMTLYARQQNANDLWLDNEAAAISAKMGAQFAAVKHLERLQGAYNEATGIPPESIVELLEMSVSLAQDIAVMKGSSVKEPDGSIDYDAIFRSIGDRGSSWIDDTRALLQDSDITEILRGIIGGE